LALSVRIREVYQTIEMDEISAQDFQYNLEGIDASDPRTDDRLTT
jgi:hypothetical protein